jgi:hypothetical protein
MLPIKIVTLVTGERIICGFTELILERENQSFNFYGILMKCPYILKLEPVFDENLEPDQNSRDLIVNFSKWNPYTPETQFKVPMQHMLAVAEPDPQIKEIYLQKFGDDLNDWEYSEDGGMSGNSVEESRLLDSNSGGEGGESRVSLDESVSDS